ncbi:sortase [Microbacterium sp.]|uniref:sortase n=1 Tax=Microbacterium sp. TaxID=51671 RepID=UPI0025E53FFA|nr:sortase [Microbacterium sp.]MBT9607233.1 sortase [Microbacterium sp.]
MTIEERPAPPAPPRRAPRRRPQYAPLSPAQVFVRGAAASLAVLVLAFLVNVLVVSHVVHFASQQQLRDTYRAQLAAGTAPVSEGDFDDHLLVDGAPVGLLSIPQLGIDEVIVEGTSSGELRQGPGHRRDTVLPGQAGVSVVMGRAAAFGGPFGRLQSLQPGESFTVRTGQGEQEFEVLGVRYAGDPTPPAPARGESRLILMTARGAPYLPSGVAYVDAKLVGDAQARGARQTTTMGLPPQAQAMATDMRTVWALVFALQFLVVAEFVAVWSYRKVGWQKTWIVFTPVLLLASVFVSDQLIRLLPNLL